LTTAFEVSETLSVRIFWTVPVTEGCSDDMPDKLVLIIDDENLPYSWVIASSAS
jgi:hypothetical protein